MLYDRHCVKWFAWVFSYNAHSCSVRLNSLSPFDRLKHRKVYVQGLKIDGVEIRVQTQPEAA